MAAEADDLRYFYSATLGRTVSFAVSDAGSTKPTEALEPGRYLVHFTDLSASAGIIWLTQGAFATVTATAAAPSTPFGLDSLRAVEITVRPGPAQGDPSERASTSDGIAGIAAAGITATVHITKVSRGRR